MITGIVTWADIDAAWAEIMETVRKNLATEDDIALNRSGDFVPAGRPMIEDIVCARASRDDLLIEYMKAAGYTVSLGADREPRVIDTAAVNQLGFGQGGAGKVT